MCCVFWKGKWHKKSKMKAAISLVVVFITVFSTCIVPVHAAMLPNEDIANPNTLITTVYYSKSECKEIYTEMTAYSTWDTLLIEALADYVGVGYFIRLNYNLALQAFYNGGYVSGYKGCKLLVYDDTAPTVLAYK